MVYAARNKKNGKVYVGQTLDLEKRKAQHEYAARKGVVHPFYDAIRADGFDVFEWLALSEVVDQAEMDEAECIHIHETNATNPEHGYNINAKWFSVSDEEANAALDAALDANPEANMFAAVDAAVDILLEKHGLQ